MSDYTPPLRDLRFQLTEVVDLAAIAKLKGFDAATPDVVDAILEGAGQFTADVVGPLNVVGDRQGSKLENGIVRTPAGFKEAYRQFVSGGWNSLAFDSEIGGQGLPFTLSTAVTEMVTSANMAFSLCPLLTVGAVEAIAQHGTPEQKRLYLPKLVSGEWTGTMNLTESHAGSDVGALKARAVPQGDGSFRITGTKIFITYGEHDMADNIIHLVLARTPNSPPGTRGISLFAVPKFLVNADGSLGQRNDLRCVSLEHKLGIHASPTAVMSYGDNGGAIGWLVGEENKGMRCMFTMMNHARLQVGLEGVAIADRAYQKALAYAQERKQGRRAGRPETDHEPIIVHADVRRNLMLMKSHVEAARGISLLAAEAYDLGHRHPDSATRALNQGIVDVLTPVVKGWSTDVGVEVASIGVQIHGGMGFIEETGAAQHYRDARITPIYEGTNGIQALDLVGRKLTIGGGQPLDEILRRMKAVKTELEKSGAAALTAVARGLGDGIAALEAATTWLREASGKDRDAASAGATAYLRLFGTVAGAYALSKGALAANRRLASPGEDAAFCRAKIVTAQFFCEQVLPPAAALLGPLTRGAGTLFAVEPEMLRT
ncbi:MAG: acyl-CoA dehydrogenase [Alphaproteobacteria bacterium]|nr:acyl-CoA dehydrogenase [Alphaproteobacteria bacterium]